MADKQYIRQMPEFKIEISGTVLKVDNKQFKDGPIKYEHWVMTDGGEIFVFTSAKRHEPRKPVKTWAGMKEYKAMEVV